MNGDRGFSAVCAGMPFLRLDTKTALSTAIVSERFDFKSQHTMDHL